MVTQLSPADPIDASELSPSDARPQLASPPAVSSTHTVCVLCPYEPPVSETFIRAHIERLPRKTVAIWGWPAAIGGRPVLPLWQRAAYKGWKLIARSGGHNQITAAYAKAFAKYRPAAVLAEYGDHAITALDACARFRIPLIAHFHGYDASRRSVLDEHRDAYQRLFREAAAIVAVSRAMQQRLVALGAPPDRVFYNPYGVDTGHFAGAAPASAPPVLVAVGRFVDKKAPHLTILAFAKARQQCPDAQLRMIGDGPLRDACVDLARALGVDRAVTFLGEQPPSTVRSEMRAARAFVQHSLEPPSGDSEGTPLAILEAGATGLAAVATRHGGIPDVILDGETGFLVSERDIDGMAAAMTALLSDSALAARLGHAARERVVTHFSVDQSLGRLAAIIDGCVERANR